MNQSRDFTQLIINLGIARGIRRLAGIMVGRAMWEYSDHQDGSENAFDLSDLESET